MLVYIYKSSDVNSKYKEMYMYDESFDLFWVLWGTKLKLHKLK